MALTTLAFFYISTRDETAARRWLERARAQARVSRDMLDRLSLQFTQRFGHDPG